MQALFAYAKQLAEEKGRHLLVPSRSEDASFYQRYFTNLKQYTPAQFSGEPAVHQYVLFGYGAHAGKLCTEQEVYFLHPYEASTNAHQHHALYESSQFVQNWLQWYEELEERIAEADRLLREGEFEAARRFYALAVEVLDSEARKEGYAHATKQLDWIDNLLRQSRRAASCRL
jgi:hypothetical protein